MKSIEIKQVLNNLDDIINVAKECKREILTGEKDSASAIGLASLESSLNTIKTIQSDNQRRIQDLIKYHEVEVETINDELRVTKTTWNGRKSAFITLAKDISSEVFDSEVRTLCNTVERL